MNRGVPRPNHDPKGFDEVLDTTESATHGLFAWLREGPGV